MSEKGDGLAYLPKIVIINSWGRNGFDVDGNL
jgi:hypothetical protein